MPKVSERLQAVLPVLRQALGVRDVLTNGRDRIWVLAGPRTLRRSLGPRGTVARWLYAACRRESPHTIRSYLDNANYWDGWEKAIAYGLSCVGIPGEWAVIPVPAATLPRRAWSARRKRWLDAGPKPRFRFCEQPPVPFGSAEGPVLIDVAGDLPSLMLTHGVSMAKLKEVRKCGGLQWPSWALSWRVPEAYGDVVFFGSTQVIVETVKPTGRPDPNMYLAGTDIWSPAARDLARLEKAIEWELSGDYDWWIGDRPSDEGGSGRRDLQDDLLIEGMAGEALVSSMSYFEQWQITEPLKTRRALVRRFRELFAVYADPAEPYVYPERDPELRIGETPYPYGELKVMGIVKLSELPLVVFPRRVARSVNRLLDEQGFSGIRYGLPYDGPLHADADDAQRRAFAELVTRSVLAWAENPCHTRGAKLGTALINDSWRSGYDPVARWITGGSKTYVWQRGYCGSKDPGPGRTARLSAPMRAFLADKQAYPSRWGLELASALAELDDPEIAAWFAEAEVSRFRLSAYDARVANDFGWFVAPVERGESVVVIRLGSTANPAAADAWPEVKESLLI